MIVRPGIDKLNTVVVVTVVVFVDIVVVVAVNYSMHPGVITTECILQYKVWRRRR